MNLAQRIKNNDLFFEVISFLKENNWVQPSYADMSYGLYFFQYHNTTDNFVFFQKELLGNVQAHIFVYCDTRYSALRVIFYAKGAAYWHGNYGLSDFSRFHIDYRSFVIRNSNQG